MAPHPAVMVMGMRGCRATDGQPQPTSPPKKSGSEILLMAVFLSPAPRRRSCGPEQRAWACRIPVLGCISCTDTSEQHFLPTRVMEAANNPGVPRLCTAQLSASCLFLGGRRCHRQRAFSFYNREKKLCRSEQLNGSQICFSAAFLHSVFMYLAWVAQH